MEAVDPIRTIVAPARAAGADVEVHTCPGADHGKVVLVCATEWGDWVRAFLDAHVTRLL